MKRLALIIFSSIFVFSGCAKVPMLVGDNVVLGEELRIQLDVSYDLYRTKSQKVTKPYYKDCLVEEQEKIVNSIRKAYSENITQLINNAGFKVVDDVADSTLKVDLRILGNGDFGSLLMYSTIDLEGEGGRLQQDKLARHGVFKALKEMPDGLGKIERNAYCVLVWQRANEEMLTRLNAFMSDISNKHLTHLVEVGLL